MPFGTYVDYDGSILTRYTESYSFSETTTQAGDFGTVNGSASITYNAGPSVLDSTNAGNNTINKTTTTGIDGFIDGEGTTEFQAFLGGYSTTESTGYTTHRKTSETELTLELPYDDGSGGFVSTTYTQITTILSETEVNYTAINSTSSFGAFGGGLGLNSIGKTAYVVGRIGEEWTRDGSNLLLLSTTNSVSLCPAMLPASLLYVDSMTTTISTVVQTLEASANVAIGGGVETTLFESLVETVTYHALQAYTTQLSVDVQFNYNIVTKNFDTSESYIANITPLTFVSTTATYLVQDEYSFVAAGGGDGELAGMVTPLMTSTLKTTKYSTMESSYFYQSGSFFDSFSYSVLKRVTYGSFYVIFHFGQTGTGGGSNSFSASGQTILVDSFVDPPTSTTLVS